jgi:hypothetical protein
VLGLDFVRQQARVITPTPIGKGPVELWRIPGYLAVVTVDGDKPFGRRMLARLAAAVRGYA